MITSEYAIVKTRRGLTLGALMRWAMIAAVGTALVVEPIIDGTGFSAAGVVMAVGGAWLLLSFFSVRGSRMAADSSSLIAAGQFDQAEEQIAASLNSFSLFRTVKLLSLHHLAVLRHAQNRWQDSAVLCRALLAQRLGSMGGLDRSSRLILAEALLELGDLPGVHENLSRLYDRRLSLREALNLLSVQVDYMARIGAWEAMMSQVMTKVEMAELLPTAPAARTQAFLALAAKRTGRADWSLWLRQRAELLVDVKRLCSDRPILSEVWNG